MSKKDKIYNSYMLLLIVCIGVYLNKVFNIGCVIRYITGIPCMACGLTRAYVYFFQGNIVEALKMHPVFFLAPIIVMYMLIELFNLNKEINRKLYKITFVSIVVFIIVYLIRLILIKDSIVQIELKDGVLYQGIKFIERRI